MTFESTGCREVPYRCIACGAEDKGTFFPEEQTPEAIQCWNCGAGRGTKSTHEMFMMGKGMFVVVPEGTSEINPNLN